MKIKKYIDNIFHNFCCELNNLKQLERDWNGYGSLSPNEIAIQNTRSILYSFFQYHWIPSRIVASAENGIGIYLKFDSKYCIIECLNDGDIIIGISNSSGNIKNWEIDSPDLINVKKVLYELLII